MVADCPRAKDRVKKWITSSTSLRNKPCLGHALGAHAPGQDPALDALPVAHHQLLAHGLAVRGAARGRCHRHRDRQLPRPDLAGLTQEPEDIEAADFYDLLNRLFADPSWANTPPGSAS
ncbi:family 1 glycosylhydrolase [Streptomyces sp. L7]